MSDAADLAAILAIDAVEARLASIDARIPAGAPGECAECGETMPRLVGGRCGFCRDGRRPPLSRFDSLPVPTLEDPAMPNPPPSPNFQVISLRAEGDALRAIRAKAEREELALGRAALVLIEEALAKAVVEERAASARQEGPITVVDLSSVPAEWLADEIMRRLADAAPAIERDAAVARAVSAEGQLATVREQLSGLLTIVGGGQ